MKSFCLLLFCASSLAFTACSKEKKVTAEAQVDGTVTLVPAPAPGPGPAPDAKLEARGIFEREYTSGLGAVHLKPVGGMRVEFTRTCLFPAELCEAFDLLPSETFLLELNNAASIYDWTLSDGKKRGTSAVGDQNAVRLVTVTGEGEVTRTEELKWSATPCDDGSGEGLEVKIRAVRKIDGGESTEESCVGYL